MQQEIYALEKIESTGHSVFLAGPTPRDLSIQSWRPEMIKTLRECGYTGDIFIPEKRGNYLDYEYVTNTYWEVEHLNKATKIIFWIPREISKMPAFTTNIEFGEFMHSGKIILAFPPEAEKMRYLEVRAQMHNIPIFHTMKDVAEYLIKN